MGIGDWGLGIGDWAQSPIPNPQSPIPNPQLNKTNCAILDYNLVKTIKLNRKQQNTKTPFQNLKCKEQQ